MVGMSRQKRIRLSDRAYLIHNWLYLYQGGSKSLLKLGAFKTWAEQHTGAAHSLEDIRTAIDELVLHGLVTVHSIELEPHDIDPSKFIL